VQARAKISALRRYLRQVGTPKDGSRMKIMAGRAALGGRRGVVVAISTPTSSRSIRRQPRHGHRVGHLF
jgi:hypothetical protein